MQNQKNPLKEHHFLLQTLSHTAFTAATLIANSRCAYIYHNPKKPDALQQLRRF